jgi:hypothetical protein
MKKVLLLMLAVLMVSSVAMADHIGIYTDDTGSSCILNSTPFQSQTAVIHKFSAGTTGSRFKIATSSPGMVFAFNTTYSTIGTYDSDISVGYGATCLTGSIVVGHLLIAGGAGPAGSMSVLTAPGQLGILYLQCNFAEKIATGGTAYVLSSGPCNEVATENSTWGQVKALYR